MFKKLFDKTFLKFLLVGVANTLVGSGIMFLLYNCFGASYWVSSAANYVCGSILSYFLNKYFTFQYSEKNLKVVAKFVINIAVCYLIAYGVAKPLALKILSGASVSVQENIAMLAGMAFFTILNYLGQKFFAFEKSNQ